MKRWLGMAGLVFVGVAGWRIGTMLSSDAVSMAVGVLFGVMAGVPTALLLMANRHTVDEAAKTSRRNGAMRQEAMQQWPQAGYLPQQPPVIVLAGPQGMAAAGQDAGRYRGYGSPMSSEFGTEFGPGVSGEMAAEWAPSGPQARRFKVVGEQEAWLDEW